MYGTYLLAISLMKLVYVLMIVTCEPEKLYKAIRGRTQMRLAWDCEPIIYIGQLGESSKLGAWKLGQRMEI